MKEKIVYKEAYLSLAAALLKTAREDLNSKDRWRKRDATIFLKSPLAETILLYFNTDLSYFLKMVAKRREREINALKPHF